MGFHLLRQFCVESPVGCEFRAPRSARCLPGCEPWAGQKPKFGHDKERVMVYSNVFSFGCALVLTEFPGHLVARGILKILYF